MWYRWLIHSTWRLASGKQVSVLPSKFIKWYRQQWTGDNFQQNIKTEHDQCHSQRTRRMWTKQGNTGVPNGTSPTSRGAQLWPNDQSYTETPLNISRIPWVSCEADTEYVWIRAWQCPFNVFRKAPIYVAHIAAAMLAVVLWRGDTPKTGEIRFMLLKNGKLRSTQWVPI